jgi:hypothetical protein
VKDTSGGTESGRKLLSRDEAAAFLSGIGYKTSRAKLAKDASKGGGCAYVIFNGRALYNPEDLLNWAAGRAGAKVHNTADRRHRNGAEASRAATSGLGATRLPQTKSRLQHSSESEGKSPDTASRTSTPWALRSPGSSGKL